MRRMLILALLLIVPALAFAQPDDTCYHRLDEIYEFMFAMQDTFPDRVQIDSVGFSQNDSIPLYLVKISNDVSIDQDRPAVAFFAPIHAEEVIGVEASIELVYNLIANPRPEYRNFRAQLEMYYMPTLNPEGLRVVYGEGEDCIHGADPTFRKNKRDNVGDGIFRYQVGMGNDSSGVDLNRNFPINWFAGDTLWHQQNETEVYDYYRGPYQTSEPEVQAIMKVCHEIKPLYSITFHSSRSGNFAEKVMYPWHWDAQNNTRTAPDLDVIAEIATTFAGILSYEPAPSGGRNGKMHDWMYAEGGWFNFQTETGPGANIQPNCQDLEDEIERILPGCIYLLNRARRASDISEHLKVTVTDPGGAPLVAEVYIPERHDGYLKPRLTDATYGVHRRPLLPGNYNVHVRKWGYEEDITQVAISPSQVSDHNVTLQPLPTHTIAIGLYDGADNTNLGGQLVIHRDYGVDTLDVTGVIVKSWPEGHYMIETWSEGYIPRRFEFDLNAEYHLNADLALIDEENTVIYDFEGDEIPMPFSFDNAEWGLSGMDSHSGIKALESYPSAYIPANGTAELVFTQNVPNNVESLTLSGWRCFELEPDDDFCVVEVSYDGGTSWSELETLNGFSRWQPFFYDLQDAITSGAVNVKIRWSITTDATDVDRGLFLDDVALLSSGNFYSVGGEIEIPGEFALDTPYPNPFNPSTNISFNVAFNAEVRISVFDILGREVMQVANGQFETGHHSMTIDMSDFASGMYFIRMDAPDFNSIQKLMLIK